MLFNADIPHNITLQEVNLKNISTAKEIFTKKLKTWNQTLRSSWIN